MTEVAILMGADNATAAREMMDVINFEKRLAEVSVTDGHSASQSQRPALLCPALLRPFPAR